jgi:ABC-2 type transport system permease protein
MPIHNPAYRAWNGLRTSEWTRWWTICSTGIARASKSAWLKRLMFAALLPLLFFAIPFFLFEQSSRDPTTWRMFAEFVRGMPQAAMLRETIGSLPVQPTPEQFDSIRHDVWSFLLLTMLRYPQSLLIVLAVGIVAPPLISQDLRTRAYLIYFARPITRLEYIVGKVGVVGFFLLSFTALPGLLLYVVGLLLSPSIDVLLTTWDLPFRILLASACLILPTTLVALAFSSLTLESRFAGFAWFAMWIFGHVTYSALVAIPTLEAHRNRQEFEPGWRLLTSPYRVLGNVQSYIFGFDGSATMVLPSFLLLAAVSAGSLVILFRRVNAPMRA